MIRESIIDGVSLWLPSAENTVAAGKSLAHSLFRRPVTVALRGELGAGKTTLLRGIAHGLGYSGPVVSPSYALVQRYALPGGGLTHVDFYRLDAPGARSLLRSAEEDATGVLCLEWAERLEEPLSGPVVEAALREERGGRSLDIAFRDLPLPSSAQVAEWRSAVELPAHVIAHCDAVADAADRLADALLSRGVVVRKLALRRAAELHDLLRFIDFRPEAAPKGGVAEKPSWIEWRERWPGAGHEEACSRFLEERGYSALAAIVAVHGLSVPSPARPLIEQRLLYYADKRVALDRVVSIEDRLEALRRRPGQRGGQGVVRRSEGDRARPVPRGAAVLIRAPTGRSPTGGS